MEIKVDPAKFKFQYLPDYASFLLKEKLEEFVLVGIRFCREADLPMMRPLSKMSESDLVAMSMESNKAILEGLASNKIAMVIEKNLDIFLNNKINDLKGNKVIDRSEVIAEDIIIGTRLKRKMFSFFLQSYTQNAVIHTLIMNEMDDYTTQEQLLTSKVLIDFRKEEEQKLSGKIAN